MLHKLIKLLLNNVIIFLHLAFLFSLLLYSTHIFLIPIEFPWRIELFLFLFFKTHIPVLFEQHILLGMFGIFRLFEIALQLQ
jgi:hypothetical protein